MANKKREGWEDDGDASSSILTSGGATSSLFGGVYREARGTEAWDGAPIPADAGARPGYVEGRKTTIPETLQQLYGILVVLNGPRKFDLRPIGQRKVTIGRQSVDIALDDASVSGQHAVITILGNDQNDAEFHILDRGTDGLPSRTGTLVNNRHIAEAVLHDRDEIQVGETRLLFVQIWPGNQ